MSQATTYRLSPSQEAAAHEGAANASQYLREADHSLGMALLEYHWNDGTALDIIEALRDYQNADGGFGNGLEVDIASPASNPFAARLAMIALRDVDAGARATLLNELQAWLVANQAPDGDWHFSSETRSENLAPWFAGWTFPSLNPACCIAGLANSLGIATRDMLARVERLFREKSSLEEARAGTFYNLLPYVEYAGGVTIPDREVWLDAIAANVATAASEGTYADASHFWEHALGGGPDLIARLPHDLLAREVDRLLTEQEPDGGWPSPYSPGWRPWVTAQACVTLARLRDGS